MPVDVASFARELGARVTLATGGGTLLLAVAENDQALDEVRKALVSVLSVEGATARDLGARPATSGPNEWCEAMSAATPTAAVLSLAPRGSLEAHTLAGIANAQREVLRSLPSPLIVVVHRRTEELLRERAPDFVTWVARAFETPPIDALQRFALAHGGAATVGVQPAVTAAPIRFLHLSDLHLRPSATKRADQDRVLSGLLEMLRRERASSPLDLIFITGDLAFSGSAAEYEVVVAFLRNLLDATGVPAERTFVVPGNHDVDRGVGRWLLRTLSGDEESTEFFVVPESRTLHAKKFDAWRSHLGALLGEHRALGLTVGADTIEYADVRGTQLAVASFNSAWFAQGNDDHGKLWLGERNVSDAARQARRASLSIALMHHPFEDLNEIERTQIEDHIERSFDLVLRGHLHKERTRTVRGPRGTNLVITAAAAYQGSQWPNGCFIGEIQPERRSVKLRPFTFGSGADPWVLDTKVFPDQSSDGYACSFSLGDRQPTSLGEESLVSNAADAFWALNRRDRVAIARRLGLEGASNRKLEEEAARLLSVSPEGLAVWSAFEKKADLSARDAPIAKLIDPFAIEIAGRMGYPLIPRTSDDFLARSLETLARIWNELRVLNRVPTLSSPTALVEVVATILRRVVQGPVSTGVRLTTGGEADFLIGRVDDPVEQRALIEVKVVNAYPDRRRRDGLDTLARLLGPDTATRGALVLFAPGATDESRSPFERLTVAGGFEVLVLQLPLP